jgi:hypothetical protein
MLMTHSAKLRVVPDEVREFSSLLNEINAGKSRDPLLVSPHPE